MAEITLTFNTTAKQDAKLAKVLAGINAQRLADELEEFLTIEAYFRYVIIEAVKSYIRQQDTVDEEALIEAFKAADLATQTQIEGLLGVEL